MLPPDSPLLVGGRQYSRTDQDWGAAVAKLQKKEILWSWNHLATLVLPSDASPRAVLEEPKLNRV